MSYRPLFFPDFLAPSFLLALLLVLAACSAQAPAPPAAGNTDSAITGAAEKPSPAGGDRIPESPEGPSPEGPEARPGAAAGAGPGPPAAPGGKSEATTAGGTPPTGGAEAPPIAEEEARQALARLPLSFEENRGQFDSRVLFAARHGSGTFFLTAEGLTAAFTRRAGVAAAPPAAGSLPRLSARPEAGEALRSSELLRGGDGAGDRSAAQPQGGAPGRPAGEGDEEPPARTESLALKILFEGSSPAVTVEGVEPLPGKVSYFRGNDPAKWVSGAPTFRRVAWRGLYPGIDLVCSGAGGSLKSEFTLATGADPERIRLRYEGQEALRMAKDGGLAIVTAWGEMREGAPSAWQEIDGARRAVEVRFDLDPAAGCAGFRLGDFDRQRPLAIDPELRLPGGR